MKGAKTTLAITAVGHHCLQAYLNHSDDATAATKPLTCECFEVVATTAFLDVVEFICQLLPVLSYGASIQVGPAVRRGRKGSGNLVTGVLDCCYGMRSDAVQARVCGKTFDTRTTGWLAFAQA
jgi:hypothetical protein